MPLSPMSAIWVRAQAFGQPLMLIVSGTSRSPIRRSSSSTSAMPRALVSTIASLQNSIPVQAIMLRRNVDGLIDSPSSASPATSESTRSGATSRMHQTLVGGGADPARAVRLGEVGDAWSAAVPDTRPAVGMHADVERCRPSAGARRRDRGRRRTAPGPGRRSAGACRYCVFENLAELLDAPVGDQELQPRPVAQPAVAVVPEDRHDAGPDVRHLVAAAPRRRAAGRASGWWTARRRPRGRNPGRARDARRRRTRCRGSRGRRPAAASRKSRS